MSLIDYSWDFAKEEFSLDLDFFNEKEQEDKLWQARTGLNIDTLCGAIETIIFMSDRPINLMKIKSMIDNDLPLRVVHESISRLQEEYESKHHGIRLMEVANGYQFRTKATYSKIISNMFKVSSMQLSPTALEVLAIIAYKQPISKNSVESIRGVDSSHIVRQLMDKRLVRITGRSEEVGRPSLFGTTAEFLEVFNLSDISQLPSESELDEMATATDLGAISDIKNIVNTGDKKAFVFDEFNELEELTEQIKDIMPDTNFTTSLKLTEKKRKTDDGEKRSAFDILEDFVDASSVEAQNKSASESETVMSFMEPKSVAASLLSDMMLNAPQIEEDELDIEVELEDSIDEVLEKSEMLLDEAHESNEQELLPSVDSIEDEKELLADALDAAFDNLIGDDTDEITEEKVSESMDETMESMDETQGKMLEEAKKLDIDLSFWE
ncbi:MAG: SMC-Scp complex subunit ScpB [Bacteriovoracaceae bacterium]|jgi:segregation and condensation protein B|nr:SMC-Scp complex subunit ScpB [Bacteriovoracaceae bacterium]